MLKHGIRRWMMAWSSRRRILSIAFILAVAALLGWWFFPALSGKHSNLPMAEARRGSFRVVLHQLGELKAVHSVSITSNTSGELADLIPEGSIVEKDQPVAWIETGELEKESERFRTSLEIAKKRLQKAEEEALLDKKLNEMAVQEAEADLEYRQTQLKNAENNLTKVHRLVNANLMPRKAIEEAELKKMSEDLQVKNGEIALQKSRDQQTSQLAMKKADLESARIEVEKAQADYDHATDQLAKAVIRAPTSGIVLYNKIWKGGKMEKVSIGSQVGPWNPILEIPDLSEMELITLVDEIDISRLALDMPASVTLDAFPEIRLTGSVSRVSTLAKEMGQDVGWGQERKSTGRKVFEVAIRINEKVAELRPGITGLVEILIQEFDDVLMVPIESVFSNDQQTYVYGLSLGTPKKISVTCGMANEFDIIIEEGLDVGDRVFLSDPSRSQ